MILVGVMAAVLWGIGAAMGAPRRARWVTIGALAAGVILVQLVLPDGHPLRAATGGDIRLWALLLGFVVLFWAYRAGLRRLRARAGGGVPAVQGTFSDAELNRYARHLILHEIGGPGQKRLKAARVLVVGAGGLGSPALLYLAAAGVGTIGVIDDDVVEASNLQRQIIHRDATVGSPKVQSAVAAMRGLNPFVTLRPYHRRLTPDIAADLIADYDIVLDGCDDIATRYLVNATCADLGKPLISGAISQWEGQISLFDPANGTPCYKCIFPEAPAEGLAPTCAEAGVVAPLPGVVGSMMALETVKAITGAGHGLGGRMLIYDALHAETRTLTLKRRADCPVCGGAPLPTPEPAP